MSQTRKRLTAETLIAENTPVVDTVSQAKKAVVVAAAALGENADDATIESAANALLTSKTASLDHIYNLVACSHPELVAAAEEEKKEAATTEEKEASKKVASEDASPELNSEEGPDPKTGGEEPVKVHEVRTNQAVLDVITHENSPSTNLSAAKSALAKTNFAMDYIAAKNDTSAPTLKETIAAVQKAVANTKVAVEAKEMMEAAASEDVEASITAGKKVTASLKKMIAGFDLMTEMNITDAVPSNLTKQNQTTAAKTEVKATDEGSDEDEGSKEAAASAGDDDLSIIDDPEAQGADEDDLQYFGDQDGDDNAESDDQDGDDDEDLDLMGLGDEGPNQDLEGDQDTTPSIDDLAGLQGVDLALNDATPLGGHNLGGEASDDDETFFGDPTQVQSSTEELPNPAPGGQSQDPTMDLKAAGKRQSTKLPRGLTASVKKDNEMNALFGVSDREIDLINREFQH